MSLLSTLAKVAVGVAVAKGAQHMMSGRGASGATAGRSSGGGMGGLLGQLSQRAGAAGGGGGLGALLAGGNGSAAGGLGGLLENVTGGSSGAAGSGSGGGLAGMLRQATGGAGAAAGGGALGAMMGALGGNQSSQPAFAARLNQSLMTGAEPETEPTPDEEAVAALMIRGMLMAAKADGRIDAGERTALLSQLEGLSPEEQHFVQAALDDPIDVQAFARDVPHDRALRVQIYAASLSAIDLDTQEEADFLNALAAALEMDPRDQEHVHQTLQGHAG